MSFRKLVRNSRSMRRYDESRHISRDTLVELADLVRYAPSAANRQPLKFFLACDAALNSRIFCHLGWAAYLTGWKGPAEGERPSAYIVLLGDSSISETVEWDHSIAAQTILLGAADAGLGGCMIGSINRKALHADLDLDGRFQILLVIALGYPAEKIVIEPVGPDGDIKYWRDEKGVHHVPKRALADLIVN